MNLTQALDKLDPQYAREDTRRLIEAFLKVNRTHQPEHVRCKIDGKTKYFHLHSRGIPSSSERKVQVTMTGHDQKLNGFHHQDW
jgi:hypothetical protein